MTDQQEMNDKQALVIRFTVSVIISSFLTAYLLCAITQTCTVSLSEDADEGSSSTFSVPVFLVLLVNLNLVLIPLLWINRKTLFLIGSWKNHEHYNVKDLMGKLKESKVVEEFEIWENLIASLGALYHPAMKQYEIGQHREELMKIIKEWEMGHYFLEYNQLTVLKNARHAVRDSSYVKSKDDVREAFLEAIHILKISEQPFLPFFSRSTLRLIVKIFKLGLMAVLDGGLIYWANTNDNDSENLWFLIPVVILNILSMIILWNVSLMVVSYYSFRLRDAFGDYSIREALTKDKPLGKMLNESLLELVGLQALFILSTIPSSYADAVVKLNETMHWPEKDIPLLNESNTSFTKKSEDLIMTLRRRMWNIRDRMMKPEEDVLDGSVCKTLKDLREELYK